MKFMNNNPILETILTACLAGIGWILHQIPTTTTTAWIVLHEVLQDGAWIAAILVGVKAGIDIKNKIKTWNKKK